MKKVLIVSIILAGLLTVSYSYAHRADRTSAEIDNPLIDFNGFLKDVERVSKVREDRRVSLKEFFKMSKDPNTIILDARSSDKYAMKHLKGARNLSFTDFTAESLASVIPSKDTRILIYCNNNFRNVPGRKIKPADDAIGDKAPAAALNISTMVSLTSYGYHNVYELGPALYENDKRLTFEASL